MAIDIATLRSIPFTLFFSLMLAGVFAYDIATFIRTYGLFPMRICYLHVRKLMPPFNFAIFHHASIAHLVVSLVSLISKASTLETHYGTIPFLLLFAVLASANAFTIRSLNVLVKQLLSRSVNINPAYCLSGITATLLSLKVLAARYMSADDRFELIPHLVKLPKIFIWLEPLVLRFLLPSQCLPLVSYWFAFLFGFIALGLGHLSDAALAGKLGEAVQRFAQRIAAILSQLASLTDNSGGSKSGGGGGGDSSAARPRAAVPAAPTGGGEKKEQPSDGMERRAGGAAQDFAGVNLAGLPTLAGGLAGMNQFASLNDPNSGPPDRSLLPSPSQPHVPSAQTPASSSRHAAAGSRGAKGGTKNGRTKQNRQRAQESHEGKHRAAAAAFESSSSGDDDEEQRQSTMPRRNWPQNATRQQQFQQGDHRPGFLQQRDDYDTRVSRAFGQDPYYNRNLGESPGVAASRFAPAKPTDIPNAGSADGVNNRRMLPFQSFPQSAAGQNVHRWHSQDEDKPNINWDFIESRAQRSLHDINPIEIEHASSMLAAHDATLNNIAERFGKEGAFHAYRARRLGQQQQQQQAGQQHFALERTPYRWRL